MSKARARKKAAPAEEPVFVDYTPQIDRCQRILRTLTGVMIGAFLLIVILTTISVGDTVQILGRGLYYVILGSTILSLATWASRVSMERRMGKNPPVAADLLKRL